MSDRRLRLLAAAIAVVWTSSVVSAVVVRGRTDPVELLPGAWAGISPGAGILDEDDETLRRHLDGIAATGARWLRVDLYWAAIERAPGELDWAEADRVIEAALDRGMSIIAVVGYTPAWARPAGTSDKHPPDDPARFASFLEEAISHFGPGRIRAWEIWNEPNVANFWEPRPDPVAYAALLEAAAEAIHASDLLATVLAGGLAPSLDEADGLGVSPETFVTRVYDAGAGDAFDALAVHPYSWPNRPLDPTTAEWNTFQAVPRLHAILERHEDGHKRIWGTEFGAPTGTHERAVSEEEQAAIIAEGYRAWLSRSWAGPLLVYAFRDAGGDPTDPEQMFGLLRRDFSPKIGLARFAATVEATICDRANRRCHQPR